MERTSSPRVGGGAAASAEEDGANELLINPQKTRGSTASSVASSEARRKKHSVPALPAPADDDKRSSGAAKPAARGEDATSLVGNMMGSRRSAPSHANSARRSDRGSVRSRSRSRDKRSERSARTKSKSRSRGSLRDDDDEDSEDEDASVSYRKRRHHRSRRSHTRSPSSRSHRHRHHRRHLRDRKHRYDDEYDDASRSYMDDDGTSVTRSEVTASEPSGAVPLRHRPSRRAMTEEEVAAAKQDLLHQFDRIDAKGYRVARKFTMASPLEEMKAEYERIRRDRSIDNSVQIQRNILMVFVSMLETAATSDFNPFDVRLEGWSSSVADSLMDYDDIFEELHDKYGGNMAQRSPELRLAFSLGLSGVVYHLNNRICGRGSSRQQRAGAGGGGGGGGGSGLLQMMGGFMGKMFGGGGGGADPQPQRQPRRAPAASPPAYAAYARPTPNTTPVPANAVGGGSQAQVQMRGPLNDDILRDLEMNALHNDARTAANERIEMVSNEDGENDRILDEMKDEAGVSVFTDHPSATQTHAPPPASPPPPAPAPAARGTGTGTRRGGGRRGGGGRGGAASSGTTQQGGDADGKTLVI